MFKKITLLSVLFVCLGFVTAPLAQDIDALMKLSQVQQATTGKQQNNLSKNQKNEDKETQNFTKTTDKKTLEAPSNLENEFNKIEYEKTQTYEVISKTILRPNLNATRNRDFKQNSFLLNDSDFDYENQDPNSSTPPLYPKNKKTTQKTAERSSKNVTEEPIKQFGYDIFKSNYLDTFQTGVTPVSNDYILGPGDHLQIRIWGKFDQVIECDVDAQGNIFLPKVGLLPVSGIRFGSINTVIKKSFESLYVNIELSVALTNLRTIKIFVLGYVNKPGAYDVSSLSTLFSALYTAGGPTKTGSLRKIQIKRHGQTYKTIDLYDYLLKGDNREDPTLKPFDTIFVPAIGDVVKIQGQVKQPAIYEITQNTSLYEVLTELAGGFGTHSYHKKITIERIKDHTEREYIDILTSNSSETKKILRKHWVTNGDIITIEPIKNEIKNGIEIGGYIARNGTFSYKEGLTLSSLISLCNGLKEGYSNKVKIFRYESDEQRKLIIVDIDTDDGKAFALKPRDIINITSMVQEYGKPKVTINGAIKNPGDYYLLKDMKITDLIVLAQLEDFADAHVIELYRKNKDKKDEVLQLNLESILSDANCSQNITLQANDQISIRIDNKLLKVKKVTLSGEFKYPGVYIALENETLSSLIKRAGGYTNKAFLRGVYFRRESISQLESEGNQHILEEEKKRLIFDQNRNDTLNKDNQLIYNSAIAFLQEKIDKSDGRLIVKLDSKNFEKSESNLILEDGDSLYIPETPNSVQVVGGVQMPTSLLYQDSQNASFYIKQAGGLSSYADSRKYLVFKADGSVVVNAKTIDRGDTIYIPEKIKIKINWLQSSSLAAQTLFSLLASLKILGLL